MKNLSELTPRELRTIADLKEQIDNIVLGLDPCCDGKGCPEQAPPRKLHWTQTPEGKRRMGRIQRKAWRNGDRRRNMETGGV